jgi:signal transduction histidine kinase
VVGERGAVAAGTTAEGPRRETGPSDATALLTLLARALQLDAAALLAATEPDGSPVPVAIHGEPKGPWTATFAVAAPGAPSTLAVRRIAHRPLDAADRALAEGAAATLGRMLEATRVGAELVRTRELLARADRLSALGTLSAGVAHEIRNPLVSVRTFIQLVPERLADEEFRTGFRDLALGEIERICGLINDLLAFSRPSPDEREPSDLNDLSAQIARLVDAEARRVDVTVVCRADPALPLVAVNDAQVKQVLMNVVLNAIEACGHHGTVEIRTRTETRGERRCCAVVVSDSGTGIAPENLERIFDPFFSTKETGSGLGLFIARQIMVAHGGEIVAAPRPEGGTDFGIYFPLGEGDA